MIDSECAIRNYCIVCGDNIKRGGESISALFIYNNRLLFQSSAVGVPTVSPLPV